MNPTNRRLSTLLCRGAAVLTSAIAAPAFAQDPAPAPAPVLAQAPAAEAPPTVASSAEAAKPAPPKPPPPYSIPWQLRPVAAANVVRSDTSVAFFENAAKETAATTVSTLLTSYKVLPKLAALVRLAYVHNEPGEKLPAKSLKGNAFVNPLIGGLYQLDLMPGLRMGLFLGMTIPIGQGGDPTKDADAAAVAAAANAGIYGRAGMDNALFAVNYLTVAPGVGIAYTSSGFTAQLEVTTLQLFRVRNKDLKNAAGKVVDPDDARTNLTSGLHLGYFLIPQLSVGGELRMQRWLSTPAVVEANPDKPSAVVADASRREAFSFAAGLRGHFKLGTYWLRPGISYGRGLDDPMKKQKYQIVQVDVPFVF